MTSQKLAWTLAGALTLTAGFVFNGMTDEEREVVTLSRLSKDRLAVAQGSGLSLLAYTNGTEEPAVRPQVTAHMMTSDEMLDDDWTVEKDAKKIWEQIKAFQGKADDKTYAKFRALADHLIKADMYVRNGISSYDFSVKMSRISIEYMQDKNADYKRFLSAGDLYEAHEALIKLDDASMYADYNGLEYSNLSSRYTSVGMTSEEINQSFATLEISLAKLAWGEFKQQWAQYNTTHDQSSKGQVLGGMSQALANTNKYIGEAYTTTGGKYSFEDFEISRRQYQCYRQLVRSQWSERELPATLPPMSICPS